MLPLLAMMSVLHTAPAQSIYNNQDDQPNWPISTRQRPCGPKPGTTDSRLVFPPELRPHNHILQVTLFLRGVRTVANEQRMCYVFVAQTSRGPQPIAVAPLLHVRQGDHMDVTIVNEMVAPVHHVADYNNNQNTPAEALKIQRAEQDDSMASMHDMSGMDGGSVPGQSDVHHMGCGQTIIEALPTPEPQTGRIYGLHRAPFEDTNIHFHGLNTSPKLPHDDVVDVLVCPKLKSGDPASQFHYSIDIPRDEPPGLYWYHPHAHGESEHELLQGVTGAILVDTATPSVPDTLTSRVLVMRDYIPLGGGTAKPRTIPSVGIPNFLEIRKQVQAEGLDGPAGWDGPLVNTGLNPIGPGQGCPNPPFPPNTDAKDLTVNGMIIPEDPGQIKYFPETSIKYGETQFYRVVNTGADTTLDLELTTDNRHNKMMVVSRDGVPIVTQNGRPTWQPVPMDHVLLMPAARVEFYVTGSAPGATMKLSALKFDTGCLGDVTLTRRALEDSRRPQEPRPGPLSPAPGRRPGPHSVLGSGAGDAGEAPRLRLYGIQRGRVSAVPGPLHHGAFEPEGRRDAVLAHGPARGRRQRRYGRGLDDPQLHPRDPRLPHPPDPLLGAVAQRARGWRGAVTRLRLRPVRDVLELDGHRASHAGFGPSPDGLPQSRTSSASSCITATSWSTRITG